MYLGKNLKEFSLMLLLIAHFTWKEKNCFLVVICKIYQCNLKYSGAKRASWVARENKARQWHVQDRWHCRVWQIKIQTRQISKERGAAIFQKRYFQVYKLDNNKEMREWMKEWMKEGRKDRRRKHNERWTDRIRNKGRKQ